jgi:hypothetical protein
VARAEQMEQASRDVAAFLVEHGLDGERNEAAVGKLETFLRRFRPEHYAALAAAGVLKA